MVSREYADTMRDIETTGQGIGRAVKYAQENANNLSYTMGVTEGYLQSVTPKSLTDHWEILDDLLDRLTILAINLDTVASQIKGQITTITDFIDTAHEIATNKEGGNVSE